MEATTGDGNFPLRSKDSTRLSYKFQRLRERIRQAIDSGELSGKLPGERQLARRFRANAKTLSKALTDLAAEGLLERSIGRGTFVRGAAPQPTSSAERWLILCDPDHANSPLVRRLLAANPLAQVSTRPLELRPSFINQFRAVIDHCAAAPAAMLRDLVVRNIAVVRVGTEPTTYSTHAVLLDRQLAANCITRDLAFAGHRKLFVVEHARRQFGTAIRAAAARLPEDVSVECGSLSEMPAAIEQGATAVICDCPEAAEQARRLLEHSEQLATHVSLVAIGVIDERPPCSGYYVTADVKANTVVQLLRDRQAHRPTTLWLSGVFREMHTIAPLSPMFPDSYQSKVGAVQV